MIIYLDFVLPQSSCGSPSTILKKVLGTALHTRKDLAVSPYTSPYRLVSTDICLWRRFHSFVGSVSARTSYFAIDGCYPLRFSTYRVHGCVRTFLPGEIQQQSFCKRGAHFTGAIIRVCLLYHKKTIHATFVQYHLGELQVAKVAYHLPQPESKKQGAHLLQVQIAQLLLR